MNENTLKYEINNDKILAYWYACILYYQVGARTLVCAHKRESAVNYTFKKGVPNTIIIINNQIHQHYDRKRSKSVWRKATSKSRRD